MHQPASSRERILDHVSGRKDNNTYHSVIQLIGKWKTLETLVRYHGSFVYDTPHCAENLKQIIPEMNLCGLVSNFYIPISVSVLYIPTISPTISLYCVCKPIVRVYKLLTDI
jgi:hypothetical protein